MDEVAFEAEHASESEYLPAEGSGVTAVRDSALRSSSPVKDDEEPVPPSAGAPLPGGNSHMFQYTGEKSVLLSVYLIIRNEDN